MALHNILPTELHYIDETKLLKIFHFRQKSSSVCLLEERVKRWMEKELFFLVETFRSRSDGLTLLPVAFPLQSDSLVVLVERVLGLQFNVSETNNCSYILRQYRWLHLDNKKTQTIVQQTNTKQNWYQVSSSKISANAEKISIVVESSFTF